MARISVEQEALTDPRFRILGIELGSPEDTQTAQAIGLYYAMHVWNYCQQRFLYVVPFSVMDALKKGIGDAMERADLASRKSDGWRIHGTKGRIEWMQKLRESNRIRQKRARKRNALVTRDDGCVTTALSQGAPALALSPALAPTQNSEKDTSSNPASPDLDTLPRVRPKKNGTPDPEQVRLFGLFYEEYPRHEGKAAAFKAWLKLKPDKPTMLAMADDMDRRLDDGSWQPDDPERVKFIPLPATYLNGRRWEDQNA